MVSGDKKISNTEVFENSESSKKSQTSGINYDHKNFEVDKNSKSSNWRKFLSLRILEKL